ncbi:universal stress protein [Alicyclobacillus dauci]|uniref:Universal stress protein n=1 Tax=Alicyclobacillus dauci TaxID=1475485 RepID=A0ABY6Z3W7_9BACL|nr:universal stress protein [Alicyclobacillus dauci]WAH37583.1 universal stress protein [Alicyclobacillus dauci]
MKWGVAMYNRILVPIEDLDTVDTVMPAVQSISGKQTGCRVTLLHVVKPVYNLGVGPGYVVDVGDVEERLDEEGQQILEAARHKFLASGLDAKIVLTSGEPAHEICRYADDDDTDLIIVGCKDKGLLEKLLIGSVSQKVTQDAPSNVLVVK